MNSFMRIYTFIYSVTVKNKKEATNLKETPEGYMQGFEKRKGKGEM